jgi:uncharacterized phage-like protein YoqJ
MPNINTLPFSKEAQTAQVIVAITGHRPDKLGNDYTLTTPKVKEIERMLTNEVRAIKKGYPNLKLMTGMALGIDTLFARIAIAENVPFIAAIPCINQSSRWLEHSRIEYERILAHPLCTTMMVSMKPYDRWCMDKRNKWMVDNANLLLAVHNGSSGGTANCMKYAKSKGLVTCILDIAQEPPKWRL